MAGAFDLARPKAAGKFICVGEEKLYIRGVTYGTFRPNKSGNDFDFRVAAADLAQMSANGVNAIRTYTPPPRWFLDLAHQRGLRSEEHTSELQSRFGISYAVFCLKKK